MLELELILKQNILYRTLHKLFLLDFLDYEALAFSLKNNPYVERQ